MSGSRRQLDDISISNTCTAPAHVIHGSAFWIRERVPTVTNVVVALANSWDRSRSSKVALFDSAHTTLYLSSIVTMPLLPFPRYSRILVENRYRLYLVPLLGVKPSELRNNPY